MSDVVERLRRQIANASLNERKYERPMTWDEADFVLSEIERLQAQNAKLREALEKIASGQLFQHAHEFARAALADKP